MVGQAFPDAPNAYGPAEISGGQITRQGTPVGSISYEHGPTHTRIASVDVHPAYQRQGIGTDAIRQVQREAAARGNPVVLSTDAFRGREAQEGQRRLYGRLGFQPNTGPGAVSERIGRRRVKEELVWRGGD